MSKKTPFVPPLPHIDSPSPETIDRLQNMTNKERKQFKKSDAYKKYVQPSLDRRKRQKRELRKEWWRNNWISIAALVLSVVSIILTLVLELL